MANQQDPKPLPWFFIGKQLTDSRTILYKDNKHNLLSQAIGKPDTLNIWYSREHIVKLLEEIDHANGDGLRVYFGMYENNHPQFSGQTCLLMAVTRAVENNGTQIHEKVEIEDEPDYSNRSTLARNLDLETPKDFNFGSPCPPICD